MPRMQIQVTCKKNRCSYCPMDCEKCSKGWIWKSAQTSAAAEWEMGLLSAACKQSNVENVFFCTTLVYFPHPFLKVMTWLIFFLICSDASKVICVRVSSFLLYNLWSSLIFSYVYWYVNVCVCMIADVGGGSKRALDPLNWSSRLLYTSDTGVEHLK